MFDISAKIGGRTRWNLRIESFIHGKNCLWLVTKGLSIFNARKSTSSQILCCVLGRFFENPESNDAWQQRLGWLKSSSKGWNFDGIDGEPTDFEWNIFTWFNTLQLSEKVQSLLYTLGETSENVTGRILFMSMLTKNVWQALDSYLCMQEDLVKDNGHSLVLVLKRSGTLSKRTVYKESWII